MPNGAASRLTRRPSAALVCALVAAAVAPPDAAAALSLQRVGEFSKPTYVTAPPRDPHRLFVVEQGGTVRVLRDGVLLSRPFLDLSRVVTQVDQGGLFSIAFAPDYATSGRLYVFYTAPRPGSATGTMLTIAELQRSAQNPDVADRSTRRTLLTVDHPRLYHHGGQLQFGPGGLLYASVGDGGGVDDPDDNAQNTHVLLGKILRIVPTPDRTPAYRIPAGNPFANGAGGARQVWAYGLRNPWRFSFDRVTGDLVIADVGQASREEVDWTPRGTGAGFDYGWRCREGTIATPGVPPCDPSGTYAPPVFEYDHSGGGCAITGGYVVRDPDLAGLYGRYLYSDYCTGDIRSLALARPAATDDRSTGLSISTPDSFGEDSCGHLYVASHDGGQVDRIAGERFTPCPAPPSIRTPPPRLGLTLARRQRLSRARSVRLGIDCNEQCTVIASGDLFVPKIRWRASIKTLTRTFEAGRGTHIAVRLPERAARAARRAIARRQRVWVHLVVIGRNAVGDWTRHRRTVRLTG